MTELTSAIAGLQLPRTQKNISPFLRGVGTQTAAHGLEASTALYVDDVYLAQESGAVFSLNNIARVEVLRGPQGTLFGRNATGGLINVITRDPSAEPHTDLKLGYANYGTVSASAYATGGLSSDLAADISFQTNHQKEGWGRNITLNTDVNMLSDLSVRNKYLWTPGAATRVEVALDYADNSTDISVTRNLLQGSIAVRGARPAPTIYDSIANVGPFVRSSQGGASLKVQHDLGTFTVKSITALRRQHDHYMNDVDQTNFFINSADQTMSFRSFQQELLASGKIGQLDLTAGVFYFRSKTAYKPLKFIRPAGGVGETDFRSRLDVDSIATYAQGSYNFTDSTAFTAGVRYTRDHKNSDLRSFAARTNPIASGTLLQQEAKDVTFPKVTWRFALDHKFSDDVMAYASYSRGFKSGQLVIFGTFNNPAVEPETLDSAEIGIKSEWLDRQLRINASAFHYDYKNIGISARRDLLTVLYNAAQAKVKGGELEIVAVPRLANGDLRLSAALSIIDGRYTSFPNALLSSPNPAGGNIQVVGSATGKRLLAAPKTSGTLGLNYRNDVGEGNLEFDTSFYFSSGFFSDPDNRLRQRSYRLLNGSLTYGFADDRTSLRLWISNALNAKYYASLATSANNDSGTPAPPRTYGVELGWRW